MILKNSSKLKELNRCATELESLGPDTEAEFLGIGAKLNELATICFSMADEALRLTTLSSFHVEDHANAEHSFIEETQTIFNEVSEQVRSTIQSLTEGEGLLLDILTEVQKIKKPVQDLAGIGKTFRVLGISIKVESSRDEHARHGFQILAEEVASIAVLVRDNCRECNERTDRVVLDINGSRSVLSNCDTSYDSGCEQSIHNILCSLEGVGSKSEALAVAMGERSSAMTQGIGEVVMAMQFHDIARQQLENVAKALRETHGKAQSVDDETEESVKELAALEVYGILSIQVAHINSIYEQVLSARQQIVLGLEATMEQARLQAVDAATLLGMDGSEGRQSVVGSLEEEIENIVVSLNSSLLVVRQAAEVSKGVYENVSEIGAFVNTIEAIAFDVKILAINAMVEAIKTGDSGRTLTVLARELSNLSLEARKGATTSIAMLERIMVHTEKQVEFSAALDQNREVVNSMIERAKTLTVTILSSMQELGSLAKKMESDSRALASQITRVIPGITFPEIMGDRIEQNWQLLCEIINQIEEEYPQFTEKNPEVEQMMEKLFQKYVMDRERSIHAQVAGGGAVLGAADTGSVDLFDDDDDGCELFHDEPAKQAGAESENEEFGDNVDLF